MELVKIEVWYFTCTIRVRIQFNNKQVVRISTKNSDIYIMEVKQWDVSGKHWARNSFMLLFLFFIFLYLSFKLLCVLRDKTWFKNKKKSFKNICYYCYFFQHDVQYYVFSKSADLLYV